MDVTTVALVLGLLGSGGAIVYYPMSILLAQAKDELEKAKALNVKLKQAAEQILSVEREIDAARDLDPRDELRVLLDASTIPGLAPVASGGPEAGDGQVEGEQELGTDSV